MDGNAEGIEVGDSVEMDVGDSVEMDVGFIVGVNGALVGLAVTGGDVTSGVGL